MNSLGTNKAMVIRIAFAVIASVVIGVAIIVVPKLVVPIDKPTKEVTLTTTTTTTTTTTELTTEATTVTTTIPDKSARLDVQTVKQDLRIKIYNKKKKLVTGYNFIVKVTYPDGSTKDFSDDNKNGSIIISSLKAGKYKVVVTNGLDAFEFSKTEATIEVKNTVKAKVVDVSDQVNKKQTGDETGMGKETKEQKLSDTVEYVASSKKEKSRTYYKVDASKVVAPKTTTTTTTTVAEDETSSTTSTTKTTTTAKTRLKDTSGNSLYKKSGDKYVEAYSNDYSKSTQYYRVEITYTYKGWQTISGERYYYDKNGNKVTGTQVIQGTQYKFDSKTGALSKNIGCDVSAHNGKIDFVKMKEAGIQFVIIRCGYRGYESGKITPDANFATNIKNARAAGLKVGIYFYSQALNDVEGVEEASYCVSQVKGTKLDFPIFFDMEGISDSNKRVSKTTLADRDAAALAFCQTVESAGYRAGVYGSRSWMTPGAEKYMKLDVRKLESYVIWIAEYNSTCKYERRLDIWQYTSGADGKAYGCASAALDLDYCYYK